MGPVYLFDLASQQARWLTARQSVIAGNVANANTPGFRGKDVTPFQEVFDGTGSMMAATNPNHLGVDQLDPATLTMKENTPWEISYSGNSVSVEQEMLKAGEVTRQYSLNTSIGKAFNQMLMSTLKGG